MTARIFTVPEYRVSSNGVTLHHASERQAVDDALDAVRLHGSASVEPPRVVPQHSLTFKALETDEWRAAMSRAVASARGGG